MKLRGQKLKGQPTQDRSPKATNLSTFPRQSSKNPTRSQTTKTAQLWEEHRGVEGPWAVPPLWRVAPGDLGTEEPELPHQGNRPRKRNSIHDAKTQLGPQRVVLPLSPLCYQTTRGTSCRQDRTITQYHTLSQTRSVIAQTNLTYTETRKRGFQGKPRGGGQTPSPDGVSYSIVFLARQNRTIAIASDFRVDGAKSPEIPQKEGVSGSEIEARNRKSLATFHRTLKSQCSIAFSSLGNRCDFWGPRWASQSQIAKIAAISVR